jgi:hypothetical protein
MNKNLIYIIVLVIAIGLIYLHKTKGGLKQVLLPNINKNFPTEQPDWDKMMRSMEIPNAIPKELPKEAPKEPILPKPSQPFPPQSQPLPQERFPQQQFPQQQLPQQQPFPR